MRRLNINSYTYVQHSGFSVARKLLAGVIRRTVLRITNGLYPGRSCN